jgi:transcriptional regulator with XRE-family HTH domain
MWLREARKQRGWTQAETASRLGVSQGYVSLLEKDQRRVSPRLARAARKFFDVPAAATRPTKDEVANPDLLAKRLAGLGYEPLEHLGRRTEANPAEVLLAALRRGDLESRLTEALPWVALRYADLSWDWLLERAKVHDAQNRLGYVVSLARQLAERRSDASSVHTLREQEERLTRSRLAEEGTLCQDSMTQAERRWLRSHRPGGAAHWNLLTDLTVDKLPYAS